MDHLHADHVHIPCETTNDPLARLLRMIHPKLFLGLSPMLTVRGDSSTISKRLKSFLHGRAANIMADVLAKQGMDRNSILCA